MLISPVKMLSRMSQYCETKFETFLQLKKNLRECNVLKAYPFTQNEFWKFLIVFLNHNSSNLWNATLSGV